MPNYRRLRIPGACYFFTVNLARRGDRLLVDQIDIFREAYRVTVFERPVYCDAMVVLPDHWHAVWTMPPGDVDYSTRNGAIKARFSMGMRRAGFTPPPPVGRSNGGVNPALRRKGEVGVWQPRFWEHCIRDEADYRAHVAYCWGNPVKHGLVETAMEWPYSSIHRDAQEGRVDHECRAGFIPPFGTVKAG